LKSVDNKERSLTSTAVPLRLTLLCQRNEKY
jgi:hypothetical protein